jgi:hypothetical protein
MYAGEGGCLHMPRSNCTEETVREVVERALREGRPIRSKKELVDILIRRCGYEDKTKSSAYRLLKKAEERGFLRFIPNYGYVLGGSEHDSLIMRTCALILDILEPGVKHPGDILRFERYYGEEVPWVAMVEFMERTLEHVITSMNGWGEEVRRVVGLYEELEQLKEQEALILGEREELIKGREAEYMGEVERILELKQWQDREYHARALPDVLISHIVRGGDLREACYNRVRELSNEWRSIYEHFCDKIEILGREAPVTYAIVQIERRRYEVRLKIEEVRGRIERWYDRLVERLKTFYINSKLSNTISGWCEDCRGSVEAELKTTARNFVKERVEESLKKLQILPGIVRITSY